MDRSFIYRCPVTGMNAQGHLEFQSASDDGNRYELVSCPACRRGHLVNVATGKLLAEERRQTTPKAPTGRNKS